MARADDCKEQNHQSKREAGLGMHHEITSNQASETFGTIGTI
jgi:hypothetical protein